MSWVRMFLMCDPAQPRTGECSLRQRVFGSNRQLGLILAVAFFAVLPSTGSVNAHADDQSYLYLDFGQTLTARLQMPFGDIDEVIGVEIGGSDSEIDAAIAENESELRAYAEVHFDVGTGGELFGKTYIETTRFADTDYVEVAYKMETGPTVPDTLQVRLDPFLDEIENRDALLLIANDWDRGVVDNEREQLARFVDSGTQEFALGGSSSWTNFRTSVEAGLDHIRTGPDHMLFILALVLPSVLVWTTSWQPASRFTSTLWRVTKIMTMFTIAHSVTFTLAGAGVVPTPSGRVTESIIALSIAVTALHNLKPIFRSREWVIAFVFGLFHGFGFASLVQSLDVSTKTQLISLAGRNVGIEIGQLVVVLLVFPALFLMRVTRAYLPIFRVACVLLIVASIGWMAERLVDAPTTTSVIIDKLVLFPRVLVVIALATAAAWFWNSRERAVGRLIPTVEETRVSTDSDDESLDDERGSEACPLPANRF